MSSPNLDQIETRAHAATAEEPFTITARGYDGQCDGCGEHKHIVITITWAEGNPDFCADCAPDNVFALHARTDVLALAARVRELEAIMTIADNNGRLSYDALRYTLAARNQENEALRRLRNEWKARAETAEAALARVRAALDSDPADDETLHDFATSISAALNTPDGAA